MSILAFRLLHAPYVRKCKYTTPQPVQILTEVGGERYNAMTSGLSW